MVPLMFLACIDSFSFFLGLNNCMLPGDPTDRPKNICSEFANPIFFCSVSPYKDKERKRKGSRGCKVSSLDLICHLWFMIMVMIMMVMVMATHTHRHTHTYIHTHSTHTHTHTRNFYYIYIITSLRYYPNILRDDDSSFKA